MGVMRSSALWSPSLQARSSMLISQGTRCSGSVSGIAYPLKYTAKPGVENFLPASDHFSVLSTPGVVGANYEIHTNSNCGGHPVHHAGYRTTPLHRARSGRPPVR